MAMSVSNGSFQLLHYHGSVFQDTSKRIPWPSMNSPPFHLSEHNMFLATVVLSHNCFKTCPMYCT